MNLATIKIELAPLENGGYAVTVPSLPGCVTWGTSFHHAVEMAREAVELWLEEMSTDDDRSPL